MPLEQITAHTYYLPASTNCGVIVSDSGDAVVVDTGIDESAGRKLLREIEGAGWRLAAIINTHAHADHFGGNEFLQKRTRAALYAPFPENTVMEYPLWEPLYLYSGAMPPKALRNKFLMAPSSSVDHLLTGGRYLIGGSALEIVPLPGHAPGQIGVTCDGVLFCADAVFGPDVLEKHGIPLFTDLEAARDTFTMLRGRPEKIFLPAHGRPAPDISQIIAANAARLSLTEDHILASLKHPQETAAVVADTCRRFGVSITLPGQYYLMQTAVMAYLSYLYNQGRITIALADNRLYWSRC